MIKKKSCQKLDAGQKNPQRTADLLAAASEVVQRQGIAGTTLRPLAAELGVAPRTLLYHFGSKDDLLVEVIRNLRHQQPHITRLLGDHTSPGLDPPHELGNAIRQLWREAKQEQARPFLALYYELTALAIRDPEQYRPLLIEADREWTESITAYLTRAGIAVEEAHAIVEALLIGYRGALCFALATDQWEAAEASIATLIESLRTWLSAAGSESADRATQS